MNPVNIISQTLTAAMNAVKLSQEIENFKKEHNIREIEIRDMFEITMENKLRVNLVFDICKNDLE